MIHPLDLPIKQFGPRFKTSPFQSANSLPLSPPPTPKSLLCLSVHPATHSSPKMGIQSHITRWAVFFQRDLGVMPAALIRAGWRELRHHHHHIRLTFFGVFPPAGASEGDSSDSWLRAQCYLCSRKWQDVKQGKKMYGISHSSMLRTACVLYINLHICLINGIILTVGKGLYFRPTIWYQLDEMWNVFKLEFKVELACNWIPWQYDSEHLDVVYRTIH